MRDTSYSAEQSLDKARLGQLLRPARYVGTVAHVRIYGAHRLVLLREVCYDGRALAVWVSSVAIDADASSVWRHLLAATPRHSGVSIRFWGRFKDHQDTERLAADVHYPEHIWVESRPGISTAIRATSDEARHSAMQ